MKVAEAIARLRGYCKPWEEGGAGENGMTEAIRPVLAEVKRLQAEISDLEDCRELLRQLGHVCGCDHVECPGERQKQARHIEEAFAEKETEIGQLQEWVNDLQSGMYINCVYCGHRYGPREDTPVAMADVLKAHIEQCPKHPLSHAKVEVERLQNELEGANDCLWMVKERIELLGEPMSATPPMSYDDAISALVFKRLKEAGAFPGHPATVTYEREVGAEKETYFKWAVNDEAAVAAEEEADG